MTTVRRPAVAGAFYPSNAKELDASVQLYLTRAGEAEGPVPKAIIAPHAGYIYSGPVAASAYARLVPAKNKITRVILLGPCHRVPVRGLATSSADAFATPLGVVPIDKDARDRALTLPQVKIFDATHAGEHSLEVHLPFLQVVLRNFKVVPLVAGDASPDEVAEVIEHLWGGSETLIVVSSDLTHYLEYSTAQRIDTATCRAIESLSPEAIGRDQACGRVPVRGLLTVAKRRGMTVTTLDLRNSGDTAGSKDRVVGYGSWMFVEKPQAPGDQISGKGSTLGTAAPPLERGATATPPVTRPPVRIQLQPSRVTHGTARVLPAAPATKSSQNADGFEGQMRSLFQRYGPAMLHLAASSIIYGLDQGTPLPVQPEDHPRELRDKGACFVTLKKAGKLRGCIGSLQAHRPLAVDLSDNGFRSAFKDPRFPKVTDDEVEQLNVSLSILSPSAPMTFRDEADLLSQLRPRIDGLIIEDSKHRALFLPSVWEQIPEAKVFLAHLKAKAGMKKDHWSPTFKAWRFIAGEYSQSELGDPGSLWLVNRA